MPAVMSTFFTASCAPIGTSDCPPAGTADAPPSPGGTFPVAGWYCPADMIPAAPDALDRARELGTGAVLTVMATEL